MTQPHDAFSDDSADVAVQVDSLILTAERGELTDAQMEQLDRLVRECPQARRIYAQYMVETVDLCSWAACPDPMDVVPAMPIPPIAPLQPHGLLVGGIHASNGIFTSGWPVAYLIATVVFAIGLAIAAIVHVSQPGQIADPGDYERFSNPQSPIPNTSSIVARITGMVDCVWEPKGLGIRDWGLDKRARGEGGGESDSPLSPLPSPLVHLGDRLALRSGLLELTYDTGARVILQGPVTYEVESPVGGRLSLGKLTAKLEKKKSEVRGQRSEPANQKSPDLCPLTSDLFAIRTPTAVVTDLGTEFGVEVDKEGGTTSHVFRGSVRIQKLAPGGTATDAGQILHANQSARVVNDGAREITVVRIAKSSDFIRDIRKPTTKILDLVDVVAGGDGFSGRRNAGIDPANGRVTHTPPKIGKDAKDFPFGDRTYHRVDSLPFVDGVFIPDGSAGPVRVDSAGHRFDDFGKTENRTAGYVWAGGTLPDGQPTVLGKIDYATPNHGALGMHANKGITFDLEAIRRANPGYRVVRFLATTGNTEPFSQKAETVYADTSVLVDGQVRFKRREITNYNGAMPINIHLGKNDRFLTLVATDGGNTIAGDWIIFGDPRLELAPDETVADSTREKSQ